MLFQLNISYPATGCQKLIEVDDERKVRIFYEKRMSQEVAVESLGDEWKVTLSYCHWELLWQRIHFNGNLGVCDHVNIWINIHGRLLR